MVFETPAGVSDAAARVASDLAYALAPWFRDGGVVTVKDPLVVMATGGTVRTVTRSGYSYSFWGGIGMEFHLDPATGAPLNIVVTQDTATGLRHPTVAEPGGRIGFNKYPVLASFDGGGWPRVLDDLAASIRRSSLMYGGPQEWDQALAPEPRRAVPASGPPEQEDTEGYVAPPAEWITWNYAGDDEDSDEDESPPSECTKCGHLFDMDDEGGTCSGCEEVTCGDCLSMCTNCEESVCGDCCEIDIQGGIICSYCLENNTWIHCARCGGFASSDMGCSGCRRR